MRQSSKTCTKRTPCHATFHYVFTGLNVKSLERALVRWVKSILGEDELGHVASFLLRGLDGAEGEWKLICGTHNFLKVWRSGKTS